jgi:O-antigen ligase
MAEENSLVVKISEVILKYSIYVLTFLLPILFLPWTSDVLDFNKQSLLVLFTSIALFSWITKVLVSGKFSINLNKTHIAVLILFLVYLASTVFSLDKYGSFWGWPRVTSESLLSLMGLVIVYFLISNAFSKKEIVKSVIILSVSSLLVGFVGVFQTLGLFLPFDFAKNTSFNTIGLVSSLGMFLAVLLPLMIILTIFSKKWHKIFFAIITALTLAVLIIINYSVIWWIVLAGMVLVLLFGVSKKDIFDLRWMGLPMFFLVLTLFFIIWKPQFPFPTRSMEVFLNQSTSFNIVLQIIKEKPILGSGPGTFVYDFLKYKSFDFNQGTLWNVKFDGAGSRVLTILATTGILGFLAFLALIIIVILNGIKFVFKKPFEEGENFLQIIAGGVLIAFLTQTIVYFLYNSNLSLDFIYFFLLACFVGLSSEERKDYTLSPSSFLTLGFTFIFTLFLIFGIGLLILDGQRYFAEVDYFKAQMFLVSGNSDRGLSLMEKAVKNNPKSDIYLSGISQVYLSKIGAIINKKDLTDEDKNNAQVLINNSINSAKIATDISPNNVNNWSVRGFIYQSLIGIISGTEDWAITSYEGAIKLEPANPYYPTQMGIVYIKKASLLSEDKITEKKQLLEEAKTQFEKAVQLKSDYADAIYFLGLTYGELGQKNEAITQISKVLELNKNNLQLKTELEKVLDNLKSEKSILNGAEEQIPLEFPLGDQPTEMLDK